MTSPALIDLILGLVAGEAALLFVMRKRWSVGTELWLTLAAGASLMLAVRGALADAGAVWIGASLVAALVAHGLYLVKSLHPTKRSRASIRTVGPGGSVNAG